MLLWLLWSSFYKVFQSLSRISFTVMISMNLFTCGMVRTNLGAFYNVPSILFPCSNFLKCLFGIKFWKYFKKLIKLMTKIKHYIVFCCLQRVYVKKNKQIITFPFCICTPDRNMLNDFTVTEAIIAVVFDKLQIWIFWHRNVIFQTDISRKVTVFWDISLLRALMRILDLEWVFSQQIKNCAKKNFHYGCNKGRQTEETVCLISIGDTCNVSPFEAEDLWLYTVSHFSENLGGNIYDL